MKLGLFFLILSGCSFSLTSKNSPKTAKGSAYTIQFSKPGWVYKQNKRSDYVFENTTDGRILLSNSFCDEFQDQPLEHLAQKTFKTVSDFKPQISQYTTFENREAYRVEGSGKVDGVKVTLKLLNTRRNNCYFDFVSINPDTAQAKQESFNDFLKAVTFK